MFIRTTYYNPEENTVPESFPEQLDMTNEKSEYSESMDNLIGLAEDLNMDIVTLTNPRREYKVIFYPSGKDLSWIEENIQEKDMVDKIFKRKGSPKPCSIYSYGNSIEEIVTDIKGKVNKQHQEILKDKMEKISYLYNAKAHLLSSEALDKVIDAFTEVE